MNTELSASFAGGPYAAAAARRALGGLRDLVGPSRLDDLSLLVSELVTNGVRHGGADEGDVVELTVVRDGERLRVMVTDWGPGFDGRIRARQKGDEAGGWGLFLVEQMADRWGVQRDGESTMVWFELQIPVGQRRAVRPLSRPLLHALAVS